MRRKTLSAMAAACLFVLPGCSSAEKASGKATRKDEGVKAVTFEGADGWQLHGIFYRTESQPVSKGQPIPAAVICHPMLSQTKETYAVLAEALAAQGVAVLAYDPRGHGESLGGTDGKRRPGWRARMGSSKEDLAFWAGLVDDLGKAKAFLIKKYKLDPRRIAVVGASVGANAALAFAVQDANLAAVALLSPGKNYRGLATFENAGKLTRPLFVAMGNQDPSAQEAPAKIFEKAVHLKAKDKRLLRYESRAHGTKLFQEHPELVRELAAWLAERLLGPARTRTPGAKP